MIKIFVENFKFGHFDHFCDSGVEDQRIKGSNAPLSVQSSQRNSDEFRGLSLRFAWWHDSWHDSKLARDVDQLRVPRAASLFFVIAALIGWRAGGVEDVEASWIIGSLERAVVLTSAETSTMLRLYEYREH